MSACRRPVRQRGAILLIALVMMAVISIIAASVVRFSIGGVRVAVNEELRSEALQNAQSLVDATLALPTNLVIDMPVGSTKCVAGVLECSRNTLVLEDASAQKIFQREDSRGSLRVRRIAPEASTPPRATGYSAVHFQSAYLQVEAGYDGTDGGWGQAELNEGVTAIVPMYGG